MAASVNQEELIEEITSQILAQLTVGGEASRWACHAVRVEEREDLVRLILECGAERIGLNSSRKIGSGNLARYIDHTLLKPDATRRQIENLCHEAVKYSFATVCINPFWVSHAAKLLKESGVRVCSVVGFPLGATPADVKAYETRRCVYAGASEIDMVINIGALKSGLDQIVRRDLESVVGVCHEQEVICKVILETALLTDEEKVKACTLSKDAGADFVKTSTGFGPGGATVEDVALMRRVVGPEMGVKAAGGIRDEEATRKMIAAGANRIGASAGVRIVREAEESK